MVPVDYVASLVVAASTSTPTRSGVDVLQITPQPRDTSWRSFLQAPQHYGYPVNQASSYEAWRDDVLAYVDEYKDWAAMPLLDLVISDFPSATTPRYLDDAKTRAVLKSSGSFVPQSKIDVELAGLYMSYLAKIGFMRVPAVGEKGTAPLPESRVSESQMAALQRLEGRGKIGAGMQANGSR